MALVSRYAVTLQIDHVKARAEAHHVMHKRMPSKTSKLLEQIVPPSPKPT